MLPAAVRDADAVRVAGGRDVVERTLLLRKQVVTRLRREVDRELLRELLHRAPSCRSESITSN